MLWFFFERVPHTTEWGWLMTYHILFAPVVGCMHAVIHAVGIGLRYV